MHPKPHSKKQLGFLIGLLGIVGSYYVIRNSIHNTSDWAFNNLIIWNAWTIPLTIFHEAAHAIVGRWQGLKVFHIRIGTGRPIFIKRVLGLTLQFNLWPVSGFTVMATNQKHRLRSRVWLAIAAGPGSHVIILVLLYFLIGSELDITRVFTQKLFTTPAPLEMLFYSNAFLLIVNLLPFKLLRKDATKTDGYLLLKVPSFTEQHIKGYLDAYAILEAQESYHTGDYARCTANYQEALSKNPDSFLLRLSLANSRLFEGNFELGRSELVALLDSPGPYGQPYRLLLMNNIAWCNLFLRDPDLLKEASVYSKELVTSPVKLASFQGTRGGVLISNGHIDQGLKLLRSAYRNHWDQTSRASVACWIAIGEAKRGNQNKANSWLNKAKELCPWLAYFAFVEKEISNALMCSEEPEPYQQ